MIWTFLKLTFGAIISGGPKWHFSDFKMHFWGFGFPGLCSRSGRVQHKSSSWVERGKRSRRARNPEKKIEKVTMGVDKKVTKKYLKNDKTWGKCYFLVAFSLLSGRAPESLFRCFFVFRGVVPCGTFFRSHSGTLALKTEDFSFKKSFFLVKRKNGFTKPVPWTENPGKIRTGAF